MTQRQNGSICAEEYVVKRGDSFYLIAHKLGVPLRDLLAANRDIHPARLMVGDVLCIPREEDDRPKPAARRLPLRMRPRWTAAAAAPAMQATAVRMAPAMQATAVRMAPAVAAVQETAVRAVLATTAAQATAVRTAPAVAAVQAAAAPATAAQPAPAAMAIPAAAPAPMPPPRPCLRLPAPWRNR